MIDDRPLVDADFYVDEHLEVAPYTKAQARGVTEQIKLQIIGVWRMIAEAYKGRIWVPLGYLNWDEYCATEFGTSRLRLPREERPEVVSSLRESGLSIRAIAAATGDHYSTVSRELGRVANATPEVDEDVLAEKLITAEDIPGGLTDASPGQTGRVAEALAKAKAQNAPESRPITGIDGKTYPANPKRKALPPSPQEETPAPDTQLSATAKWKTTTRRVLNQYACALEKQAAEAETRGGMVMVSASDALKIAGTLRITADIMNQVYGVSG